MTVFRNVMVYLGFGPDEEYDDSYFLDEHYDDAEGESDTVRRLPAGGRSAGRHDQAAYVDEPLDSSPVGAVRPLQSVEDRGDHPEERNVRVRRVSEEIDLRSVEGGEPVEDRSRERVGAGAASGVSLASRASRLERDNGPVVRAVPMRRNNPVTVNPDSFADAKEVADEFMANTPVIMNLQGLDRELARRLIDFASGVCYSLGGSMEKIASQVFLLTPSSVELSTEERLRIESDNFVR